MDTRCCGYFLRFDEHSGRRLVGAALLLAAVWLSAAAAAQEAAQDESKEPPRVLTIAVKHAEAMNVAKLLSEVTPGPVRVAVDASTNTLVLSGPSAAVERAIQTVALLDVPNEKAAPQRRFIAVPQGVSKELLSAAMMLLGRGSRVSSVDNTLVVFGPEADQQAVAELVERVTADREPRAAEGRPVQIAFYLLEAALSDAKADRTPGGAALPGALAPVAQSLAEAGFSNARLIAPLIVHTSTAGQRFRVTGASPEATELEIKGLVSGGPTPQTVRLEVDASVRRAVPLSPDSRGQGLPQRMLNVFNLDTTITLPWNEYVVLAASPSDPTEPTGYALVVRLTSPSAAAAKPGTPAGR